jgi:hypothetical protein
MDGVILKKDNQSCVQIDQNPEFHQRIKYIDIRYYFIQRHISNENIKLEWVPEIDQLVDGLIKILSQPAFDRFVTSIELTDGPLNK